MVSTGSMGAAAKLIGNAANLSGLQPLNTVVSSANVAGKIFNIASALLSPATNEGSASSKAAKGTTSVSDVSNVINDILSRLKKSTALFEKNKQKINSSNKKCQNIGNQGTAQLSKSVSLVNGNGDMVGLDVNIEESADNGKKNRNSVNDSCNINNAESIKNSDENESVSDSNNKGNEESTVLADSENKPDENSILIKNKIDDSSKDDNKQVYSCDWGNGAKTSKEIDNENKNIEENPNNNLKEDDNNSSKEVENKTSDKKDDKANEKTYKEKLNSKNKVINNKLKDLKKQKINILDKKNKSEEDDELDELKQRVQTDSEGVQSVDSENQIALSKEVKYKNQINSNIKNGKKDLKTADKLTNTAKSLANSSITSLSSGIASNLAAAPLFASKYTEAAGAAEAAAAAASNVVAAGLCESATSVENKSIEKQYNVENIANQTISSIIPQFQQSVKQRLANNKQSVQVQIDTRKEIKKKKNEMSGLSSDSTENNNILANISNQENALLMQKSGTLNIGEVSETCFPIDFIA